MTKQEFIEILKSQREKYLKDTKLFADNKMLADELDFIIDMAEDIIQPTNWISVDDAFPSDNQEMLIAIEKIGVSIGYYNHLECEWFTQNNEEWGFIITHWQPLPQPPKE